MDTELLLLIMSLIFFVAFDISLVRLCYMTLPLPSANFVMIATLLTMVGILAYHFYFNDNI